MHRQRTQGSRTGGVPRLSQRPRCTTACLSAEALLRRRHPARYFVRGTRCSVPLRLRPAAGAHSHLLNADSRLDGGNCSHAHRPPFSVVLYSTSRLTRGQRAHGEAAGDSSPTARRWRFSAVPLPTTLSTANGVPADRCLLPRERQWDPRDAQHSGTRILRRRSVSIVPCSSERGRLDLAGSPSSASLHSEPPRARGPCRPPRVTRRFCARSASNRSTP